jgi:uncharacterized protein YwqG
MDSIRELLVENGLGRVAAQIAAGVKHSVELAPGKPGEGSTHRLGGRPNLPPAVEWPVWRGCPLGFVAQLELSEVPPIEGLDLPGSGSLCFFSEGGKVWGFQPEHAGSARVIYSPEPLAAFPLREFPSDLPENLRFDAVEMIARPSHVAIPNPQDICVQSLELQPEECESYFRVHEEWVARTMETFHRIGGYPDCIQIGCDPKLEAHLVSQGLDCGHQSGYAEGKERGLWPGAAEWELLLQVDSEGGIGMQWGDDGRLYFLIHRSALRERAFEKAWMILQCD